MLDLDIHIEFGTHILNTKMELTSGTVVGLYGKSGVGKSTLLKVVAGLHPTTTSTILMQETPWTSQGKILVPPQHRSVGMVFQDFALFPNLTVRQNLQYAQKVSDEQFRLLIDTLAIENILEKKSNHISGGQKQRTAIGRALAYDPKLLLMDEPFSALDDEVRNKIKSFLKDYILTNNKIALIASHDRSDLEFFTDKIVNLQAQSSNV